MKRDQIIFLFLKNKQKNPKQIRSHYDVEDEELTKGAGLQQLADCITLFVRYKFANEVLCENISICLTIGLGSICKAADI